MRRIIEPGRLGRGLLASGMGSPQPFGVPGNWTLVWKAFTNNENALDTSSFFTAGSAEDIATGRTTFDYGPNPNAWDPANVAVSGGVVTCTLTAGSPPMGGGIATRGKVNVPYSFLQYEAQFLGPQGWAAGWEQSPTDAGGAEPPVKEIDSYEQKGWVPSQATIHNVINNYAPKNEDPHDAVSDPSTWRKIGRLWQPGVIKFFVDGALSATSAITFSPNADSYMLFDVTAAGGGSETAVAKFRNMYLWTGTPF